MEDKITFPFKARVVKKSEVSPLQKNEIVNVMKLVDSNECLCGMFVQIEWNGRKFGVPLAQLYPVEMSGKFAKDTIEAVEDWHYWLDRGYSF